MRHCVLCHAVVGSVPYATVRHKRIIKPLVSYCLLEGKSLLTESHSPMPFIYPARYCLVFFLISFVYFQWNPLSFYFSDKLYMQFLYRLHVENEMSEKSLKSTTTCIMTRKKTAKDTKQKVWDQGCWWCTLIHLWCICKHRTLRRKCKCNFKLYLEIGKCLSQLKALNINVETTIVYTQVYTKILSMSRPNARCRLIVVFFVIDIWKLKLPHHKACSSLIVAIELANFEPVCSHLRILTDLC